MQKVNINKGISIRLILVIVVFSSFVACDFLPSKPKKVEFLDQSFAVIMPASWSLRSDLNDVADLQMGNSFKEAYALIISENRMNFDDITMEDHSDITRSMIKQNIKNYHESNPETIDIGGYRALRYRLSGSVNISVVFTSACPMSSWTTRMFTPSSSKWVAKECLLCRIRHKRHYADSRIMPTSISLFPHPTVIPIFFFSVPLVNSA